MRVLTASVRGPAHQRAMRPNEDACRGAATATSFWLAVADGMGSRSQARIGARAAVTAAARAWRLWSTADEADPADFARLCALLWRLALPRDVAPADAATTLLFCGGFTNRDGLCAQLGDGLIGYSLAGAFESLTASRDGFSNQTKGLGMPLTLADWTLRRIPSVAPGASYLLASDGISDDLLLDRAAAMTEWLIRDFGALPRSAGSLGLQRTLRNWPVPHHLDDKSIALAWNPAT